MNHFGNILPPIWLFQLRKKGILYISSETLEEMNRFIIEDFAYKNGAKIITLPDGILIKSTCNTQTNAA